MIRTFRYKLYRSKRTRHLERQLETAREVWNRCLALHRRYYKFTGKYLHKFRLQKQITKWKNRERFGHWYGLGNQAIQEITERIDKGYKAFFKGDLKRPPKFRGRFRQKSFTLKTAGWGFCGNRRIRIGDKTYRFHESREVLGRPKTITIKKDSVGDWWITVCSDVETEFEPIPKSGRSAGFDFGLKTFLTGSDGEKIQSPQFLKRELAALRRRSRLHSRKQKGSRNRNRSRIDLARLHRSIADRRNDWQWKTARRLVEQYDLLCFEDLQMSGMQKLWGRKVNDLAFPEFLHKLQWLAQKTGKSVVKIDRWAPTSKKCGTCGELNPDLKLRDRSWKCPHCGAILDRDLNAAKNIFEIGVADFDGFGHEPAEEVVSDTDCFAVRASTSDAGIPRL